MNLIPIIPNNLLGDFIEVNCLSLGVFESVVVVTFQSIFHLNVHQNNLIIIFKKKCYTSTLKQLENIKK